MTKLSQTVCDLSEAKGMTKNMRKEGSIKINEDIIHYQVDLLDEESKTDIDEGHVTGLVLKRKGEVAAEYDGEWKTEPADQNTEVALAVMMMEYY